VWPPPIVVPVIHGTIASSLAGAARRPAVSHGVSRDPLRRCDPREGPLDQGRAARRNEIKSSIPTRSAMSSTTAICANFALVAGEAPLGPAGAAPLGTLVTEAKTDSTDPSSRPGAHTRGPWFTARAYRQMGRWVAAPPGPGHRPTAPAHASQPAGTPRAATCPRIPGFVPSGHPRTPHRSRTSVVTAGRHKPAPRWSDRLVSLGRTRAARAAPTAPHGPHLGSTTRASTPHEHP